MTLDTAIELSWLRMQTGVRIRIKTFNPEAEIHYKDPKIAWDDRSFYANEKIPAWEKILEDDNLRSLYGDDQMIKPFTLVGKPIQWNVRFADESTVYTIHDIDKGDKIVFTYPKWYRPSLFMASNRFVYVLIQIFVVIVLIVVVFAVMYMWMNYKH